MPVVVAIVNPAQKCPNEKKGSNKSQKAEQNEKSLKEIVKSKVTKQCLRTFAYK